MCLARAAAPALACILSWAWFDRAASAVEYCETSILVVVRLDEDCHYAGCQRIMLQPRTRAVCSHCRSLLSTVRRTYATAVQKPIKDTAAAAAAINTQDVTAFTPPTAPMPMRNKVAFQLKTYKPRTPGQRHLRRPINDHLWKGKPLRKLTFTKLGHGKGGRNNSGRVTVRHRGGGHRRRIRTVDYVRAEPGTHLVERIEYDPNRSAHLALVENVKTKVKSYIIAAEGMRAGDTVESFRAGIPKELLASMGGVIDPGILAARTAFRGNCLPMHMVPLGTQVYCVGSTPEKGAVFCRSAGTYATVIAKEERGKKVIDVTVRLQSGEVRKVSKDACATIGVASNPHHHFTQLGKAGRSRWLNIRPTVRGVAMNAVDHPHGGGRGKSKGNVHPVSIWGTPVSHISISCASSSMLTRIVGERRLQDAQEAQSEPACCSGKTTQSRKAKSEEIAGSICHRKHLRHSMSIKSQIEMPSSCTCSHTWYLFSYCLFVGSASESRGLGLMGSDISTSYLH